MEIQERVEGTATVVSVKGEITLNKGADVQLKDKIQSLLQQGRVRLVLDLGGVSYVDSAGLGQLVQLHATSVSHGGKLKLVHLTKRLNDLLVVTRLSTVFDCYDTEAEALSSFYA